MTSDQLPVTNPKSPNGPVGAVLVVGSGIGGIQSSLELADAGFKVYLLDEGPAIGGHTDSRQRTCGTIVGGRQARQEGRRQQRHRSQEEAK